MILIGEKLNGSIPAVGAAIAAWDETFLTERVRAQAAAKPDYIDVCASVDPALEADTLWKLVRLTESVTEIPVCLDSPDPAAIAAVLPRCKRPGMINSVSLEKGKTETLFPLIAGTEWNCVALLCDGDGIPDTVEKRLAILDELIRRADQAGIARSRLYVDPLVVSLSTSDTAAQLFFDCVRAIRSRYPEVHVTSGLSNSSFGLPCRKYVNQAFLLLSMEAGMDSAILDPCNRDLMSLLYAAEALLGRDEYCRRYIAAVSTPPSGNAPSSGNGAPGQEKAALSAIAMVSEAVQTGKAKQIAELVTAALNTGAAPEAVLNDGMISAMSQVGERFSRGEAFVPEMLMSARTMKKGVEALRPSLTAGAVGGKGKVVIGTVAGDIHDIGKNLVALMMESAGFETVDLGVDVSAEQFVDAAADPGVRIVALSALLTTSMPAMKEIVSALKADKTARYLVFVGGAPITERFASEIGADVYTVDAAAAAARARELIH